jgi:transposase
VASSPDLNPIEHLLDELKRRVRARIPVATFIPELMVAVEEEWHNIPQERIVNLIRSMPKLLFERGEVIRDSKIKELLL